MESIALNHQQRHAPESLDTSNRPLSTGYFTATLEHHQYKVLCTRIRQGFAKHYDADINQFMPLLVCLVTTKERYCCFGLRSANELLFIENYLPRPLSSYLKQWQIAPQQCVEMGNLVSTHSETTLSHFVILAKALKQAHKKSLLFCATAHIRALLSRIGAPFEVVCDAQPECLSDQGRCWGSYYFNRPQVCRVDIDSVCKYIDNTPKLQTLANSLSEEVSTLAWQGKML
ncbi:thermostable hemolysin [Pseudoalteromonas ruthenica]|uniref:thermostable hemolysin n=1 Tax=Pseudoalteromonas ruthenica TaxID=151081 RepID=UPI0012478437|nr:thermostable hemolysin [Pseudoalteromonas ruthenica]